MNTTQQILGALLFLAVMIASVSVVPSNGTVQPSEVPASGPQTVDCPDAITSRMAPPTPVSPGIWRAIPECVGDCID